jgi:uncharacterized membrane protein YdjX (TVP38/TMEM64 family)
VELLISLGEWLQAHPQTAGLVFVLVIAAILAVGLPGGNVLMLSSGLLFGTLPGAALVTTGAVLGAAVTFFLVRTFIGGWLDRRAGNARDAVRSFVEHGNAPLLVLPRLIPVIPFFLINVGYTAAGVPLRTYLLTTVVGVVPPALLFAKIGSQFRGMQELSRAGVLEVLFSPGLYVPLGLLILLMLFGWWFTHERRRGRGGPGTRDS